MATPLNAYPDAPEAHVCGAVLPATPAMHDVTCNDIEGTSEPFE